MTHINYKIILKIIQDIYLSHVMLYHICCFKSELDTVCRSMVMVVSQVHGPYIGLFAPTELVGGDYAFGMLQRETGTHRRP